MKIIYKTVKCTDKDFLMYYLNNENITLNNELHPENGFPMGFLAIDNDSNEVIGAGMLIDENMQNQILSYNQNDNDTNPWMIALNVKKEYRRNKVGKNLVNEMISYCNELGYSKINLHTETAKDFYQKHWLVNFCSRYIIKDENNENVFTNTFRIDVKKNIHKIMNEKQQEVILRIIAKGTLAQLQELVEKENIDLHYQSDYYLYWAVFHEKEDMQKYLIEAGLNPETTRPRLEYAFPYGLKRIQAYYNEVQARLAYDEINGSIKNTYNKGKKLKV